MKTAAVTVAVAGVFLLPVAGPSAQGVNDAQIASIVVTANQVDIDAGKMAKKQAKGKEVKEFADKANDFALALNTIQLAISGLEGDVEDQLHHVRKLSENLPPLDAFLKTIAAVVTRWRITSRSSTPSTGR